jgi:CRP-like cAMP-binding protein
MVTNTLLNLYSFFSFLKPDQLVQLAAISAEDIYESGDFIFHEGTPAKWLYILTKGSIDLLYLVDLHCYPPDTKELLFASIQPGEIFGISALIEPNIFTSTARASKQSKVIKIQSQGLLDLCTNDNKLAYGLYSQVAKAAIERLNKTRLQLATTRVSEVTYE